MEEQEQQNEVNEEQNVQMEPTSLSSPPSHKKLIIGIVAVFVLVVVGIAGAYFVFQNLLNPTSELTSEEEKLIHPKGEERTQPVASIAVVDIPYDTLVRTCNKNENEEEKFCCLISVEYMKFGQYTSPVNNTCSQGFSTITEEKCVGALSWCEPDSGTLFSNSLNVQPFLSENETKDWGVYRSEYYGFEVKCPPDFTAHNEDSEIICSREDFIIGLDAISLSEDWSFEKRIFQYGRFLREPLYEAGLYPYIEEPVGDLLERRSFHSFPAILSSRIYTRRGDQFIFFWIDDPVVINDEGRRQVYGFGYTTDLKRPTLEALQQDEKHKIFEAVLSTFKKIKE